MAGPHGGVPVISPTEVERYILNITAQREEFASRLGSSQGAQSRGNGGGGGGGEEWGMGKFDEMDVVDDEDLWDYLNYINYIGSVPFQLTY